MSDQPMTSLTPMTQEQQEQRTDALMAARGQSGFALNRPKLKPAEPIEEPEPLKIGDFKSHAEDALLSYAAAGQLVGRSPTTIKRWVEQKLVKVVRDPSGSKRIRISQLKHVYNALNS